MNLYLKNIKQYLFPLFLFFVSLFLIFSFATTIYLGHNSILQFNSDVLIDKKLYFISFFYSLLVYLVGSTITICSIISLLYASILLLKQKFSYSIYRSVIFFIAILLGSVVVEFSAAGFGGIIGYYVNKFLTSRFDVFLTKIWVKSLFVISLVLLTEISFITMFSWVNTIKNYMTPIFKYTFNFLDYCSRSLISWVGALYNGKILSNPDGSDIEYGSSDIETTNFWSEYFDSKIKDAVPSISLEPAIEVSNSEQKMVTSNIQKNYHYTLPSTEILTEVPEVKEDKKFLQEIEDQSRILENKLEKFGVFGKVVSVQYGPVVTLFEYEPAADSKLSKIVSLEDDLAMALQATSIRIIAPIPGKAVVGFEVANKNPRSVYFASIIQSDEFKKFKGYLPIALGEDTIGKKIVVDLASMPHLLVAGSTGSGKSVALNTMLISLLYKYDPEELKLILIDPKRLEFSAYHDIAHLLFPIVTNPKTAVDVLKWLVKTMEDRYEQLAALNVKNIFEYHNAYGLDAKKDMPFIVLIIDELADLMMTAGKEVEFSITRIAQMARAAGIHMIVATQRPSVDVITGLIKVNFPSRISFRVTSKVDSRTILDTIGAEKLLGRGDMLFLGSNNSHMLRVHGAYISNKEISAIVDHIKQQKNAEYIELSKLNVISADAESNDELYIDIINYLKSVDEVSISLLQRKFRIGYNRSARIIEQLEQHGYIRPSDGSKMRKVVKQVNN